MFYNVMRHMIIAVHPEQQYYFDDVSYNDSYVI